MWPSSVLAVERTVTMYGDQSRLNLIPVHSEQTSVVNGYGIGKRSSQDSALCHVPGHLQSSDKSYSKMMVAMLASEQIDHPSWLLGSWLSGAPSLPLPDGVCLTSPPFACASQPKLGGETQRNCQSRRTMKEPLRRGNPTTIEKASVAQTQGQPYQLSPSRRRK